jgi:hypothetical protein
MHVVRDIGKADDAQLAAIRENATRKHSRATGVLR